MYVAYIEDDASQNQFHEFVLSAHPLDEQVQPSCIAVPDALLRDAGIPEDAEVQIVCINGAIILCQESALETEEWTEVLQSLSCAAEIAEQMPPDMGEAVHMLQDYAKEAAEGFKDDESDQQGN